MHQRGNDFLGLHLVGCIEGASIGGHLADLPAEVSIIERGQTDFSTELAAARRSAAYMARNPDAEYDPDHHSSSTHVLVRGYSKRQRIGGIDVGTLELDDHTQIRAWTVATDEYQLPNGGRVWAVASVDHDGIGPHLLVWHWEPAAETLVLPRYGAGVPGDLARSRLNQRLARVVQLSTSGLDETEIRQHLIAVHSPSSELEHAEARLWLVERWSQVLETLRIETYEEEASRPDLATKVDLPAPRLIKSAVEAEQYAAEYMRALGFFDAAATLGGADGGVDVRSSQAVAQVKMEGVLSGRPVLQQLKGVAVVEGRVALFFSLAGYTAQAVEWAEDANIACFEFAFDGSVVPRTSLAGRLVGGDRTLPD